MARRPADPTTGRERRLQGFRGGTDGPETLAVPFSQVPQEAPGVAPGMLAVEIALSGYFFALAGTTDPPGELLIAFDRPANFVRISPPWSCARDDAFQTVWLIRALSTPSSSNLNYQLSSSWDRAFTELALSPRGANAGGSGMNVILAPNKNTANYVQAAGANALRRGLLVTNEDAGTDHFVSTVQAANGYAWKVRAETPPLWLPFTGILYADAPAVGPPALIQVAEVLS